MGTEERADFDSSPEEPSGRTTGNKYFKEFMGLVQVSMRNWWWGEPLGATCGGIGGAWLGHDNDLPVDEVLGVAVSIVGLTIGSVFAVLAMVTRACDNTFLKKARKAHLLPMVNYLWPFFTIIGMGIPSIIFLLLMAGTSEDAPTVFRMAVSAAAGFCVLWTLAGLLPAMGALIVFTRLIEKTSGVND